MATRHGSTGLILIASFKLVKALLLVAVGIGALNILHKDLAASVTHWIEVLRVDPENRYIHRLLARLFSVTPKQLRELSVGTFIYATLLSIESVGLFLRKRWAEYFTVITTAALIPLELYEMAKHFTPVKVAVLAVNIAIVWYLIAGLHTPKIAARVKRPASLPTV